MNGEGSRYAYKAHELYAVRPGNTELSKLLEHVGVRLRTDTGEWRSVYFEGAEIERAMILAVPVGDAVEEHVGVLRGLLCNDGCHGSR